ncbi:MAG: HAD family hydrolase [Nanoarchaeota archaeon]|nr:HAD family hydrolase [Nanoarchaeota archaeon]
MGFLDENMKAVAFDLDDTLIDGKRMHHAALIEALNKFGIKRKRLKWIRGATSEEILKYNLPSLDIALIKKIAIYKRKVVKKYLKLAKPIPYSHELLKHLKQKGLILGLITNNSHNEIKAFLKHFKFSFFHVVVGMDHAKPKPNPDMFNLFMKKANISKKDFVYVGDSNHDILACKKAGIRIILMTKIHKAKLFKKADFVAKNLKDVEKIINSI